MPRHDSIYAACDGSGEPPIGPSGPKLSQESGIPASTIKVFYQVLVDTFVGHFINAYSRNARRRLLTTPRFCFFDMGVRNAAADVPLDARLLSVEGGPLLEQ